MVLEALREFDDDVLVEAAPRVHDLLATLARAAAMRLAVTPERCAQAMVELAVARPGAPSGSYLSYHTFTRRMPVRPATLSPRVRRLEHSQRVWRLTLEQLAKAGHPAKWYSHEG